MTLDLPLSQVVQKIQAGQLNPTSLVNRVYDQIEKFDHELNVYRSLVPRERSLQRAETIGQRISNGERVGKLAGLPVAIKDNLSVADQYLTTGCSSKILEGYYSPYDATVVRLLKEEDALVIGTTNMDEFAMGSSNEHSAYGPTLNPWDSSRVPGGSSGGSAVAVATGMAFAALGSDTGGSVRQPAAFCGITGFKPTYGALSRYGLVAYGSSLDQVGCLTRTAEDNAFLFEAIQKSDPKDSTSLVTDLKLHDEQIELSSLKFCLPKEYLDSQAVSKDVLEATSFMADWLEKQGATVEHKSLGFLDCLIPAYYVISFAEASSNLGRFDGVRYGLREGNGGLQELYRKTRESGFGAEVKRRIMLGTFVLSAGYYDAYYGKANQIRAFIEKKTHALLRDFDFLIGPVSPGVPFLCGEKSEDPLAMYFEDTYSVLANFTRCPAIAIPAGMSEDKLPIGFQLMSKPMDDHRLLKVCKAIQQITNFHTRRPQQWPS
jgi:aspartyl-tRNA(Asn)/glutamyl-tRNA(Gln) amidotransferase subunit A